MLTYARVEPDPGDPVFVATAIASSGEVLEFSMTQNSTVAVYVNGELFDFFPKPRLLVPRFFGTRRMLTALESLCTQRTPDVVQEFRATPILLASCSGGGVHA